MKKFGLIGHPIGHSTSPAVFSAGYRGKPYTYDLIEGEDFEESYRRFIESYDGINVTAPFKEPAFARADLHSPECEVIGATNLLIKTPEGVKAYNTDYYGIIFSILLGFGVNVENFPATPSAEECRAALDRAGKLASDIGGAKGDDVKSSEGETERFMTGRVRKALVVGCGGAGKAAAVAAVNLGFDTTLMNRTIDKAFVTAERIASAIARSAHTKTPADAGTPADTEAPTPASAEIPPAPVGQLTVRPLEDFAECLEQNELIVYTLPCPIDALEEIADIPSTRNATVSDLNTTRDIAGDATKKPTQDNNTPAREKAAQTSSKKVFIEANYRDPAFTPEIIAKISTLYPEARFIRGNIWHLYQAWSGYILFTGETPDLAAMAAVDK